MSAVAALLVSYFGGPGFTADECRKRIIRGAVPNFFTDSRYIGRKLDAYGAFTYDMNTKPQSPVLSWGESVPASLPHNGSARVPVKASDPQGLKVKLSLKNFTNGVSIEYSYEEGYNLVINALNMRPGDYTATVVAVNEDGMTAELPASFKILDDIAPAAIPDPSTQRYVINAPEESIRVDLKPLFEDPDGDPLSFKARVEDGKDVISAEAGEDGILVVNGVKPGLSSVVVTASDGKLSCDYTIHFAVKDIKRDVRLESSAVTGTNLKLFVQTSESVLVGVKILNSSGAVVVKVGEMADIFNPALIDIRELAPGTYTLVATIDKHDNCLRFTRL